MIQEDGSVNQESDPVVEVQGVGRIAKGISEFSPVAKLTSASCWVAWVLIVYSGEAFFVPTDQISGFVTTTYTASTLAFAGNFILLSFFGERGYHLLANRLVMSLLGLAATLATIGVVLCSAGILPGWITVPTSVATGLATSAIAMRCACLFVELPLKTGILGAVGAMIVALLLYSFAISIPKIVGIIVLCVMPLLAAFFTFCDYEIDRSAHGDGDREMPHGFWRFFLGAFIFAVALGIIRGYYPNGLQGGEFAISRSWSCAADVVGLFVIFLFMAAQRPRFSFGLLCYWVFLIITLVFSLVSILGIQSVWLGAFSSAGTVVMDLMVWCSLICIVHKSGHSALHVFGIGYSSAALGSTVGWALGAQLYAIAVTPQELAVVDSLVFAIVIFSALFILNQRDLRTMTAPNHKVGDDEVDGVDADARRDVSVRPRFTLRCRALAQEHGLSSREAEVMLLMAKGKDAQAIAEELFVSYNTARTHIRNVYGKCGVHNRHDFIELIDNAEVPGRPV